MNENKGFEFFGRSSGRSKCDKPNLSSKPKSSKEVYVIGEPKFVGKIIASKELTCELPLCECGSGKTVSFKDWSTKKRHCSDCVPKD